MDWDTIRGAIIVGGAALWEFGMNNVEAIIDWVRWDWIMWGLAADVEFLALWAILMS